MFNSINPDNIDEVLDAHIQYARLDNHINPNLTTNVRTFHRDIYISCALSAAILYGKRWEVSQGHSTKYPVEVHFFHNGYKFYSCYTFDDYKRILNNLLGW